MNNQELELYIHIPFCVKKCNYCDFLSFTSEPFTRELYTNALCSEIEYKGRKLNDRIVTSIYIGGGTPSVLETKYISKIVDVINDTFTINEETEFTIECNPGTVSRESLNVYKMLGINRLSFGVQSSNDDELKLLGRIHDYSSFINSLDYALRAGFINISADIMYGLPHQTIKTLRKTLSDVSRFNLKHLSVYSLIIEENTQFYNEYYDDYVTQSNGNLTSFLPSEDELSEMTDFVHAYLNNRGYKQYEISNYAKKGYECRHNIGYWKRKEYLGVGLGAASLIDEVRYKNITDIETYIKNWTFTNPINEYDEVTTLTLNERMAEFMMLGLRMTDGVSSTDFFNAFNHPLGNVYSNQIASLQDKGLIIDDGGIIKPTAKGLDLQNVIAREFV